MVVQIFRDRKEVVISGLPTQWVVERIIKDVNDMIQTKDNTPVYFFEGSPGAYGGGLVVRILLNVSLGDNEINALTKYFKLRNADVNVY